MVFMLLLKILKNPVEGLIGICFDRFVASLFETLAWSLQTLLSFMSTDADTIHNYGSWANSKKREILPSPNRE